MMSKGTLLIGLALLTVGCGVEAPDGLAVPRVGTTHAGLIPADGAADATSEDTVPLEDTGISAVEPDRGSPAGGELVFVQGWGFNDSVKVYFDEFEAPEVFLVNSKKLRVITPKHALGRADVHVWWPSGQTRTLPGGFLFTANLGVDTVEPAQGPISGGTPFRVTGEGFTEKTKLVVGRRLAMSIQVVDEKTILAITPPGEEGGPADVLISNELGTYQKKRAFTYTVAPDVQSVEPAAGRPGDIVTVRGRWLTTVTRVVLGSMDAEVVARSSDGLKVRVPVGAGTVAVTATGIWGWDTLESGFLYLDGATAPGVSAVMPGSGSSEGGERVSVVDCAEVQGAVTAPAVRFGGQQAEVLERFEAQCTVVVRTPSGSGSVDVDVGKGVIPSGFLYVDRVTVERLTPPSGDHAGGTRVVLRGKRIPQDVQITVGPFPALQTKWVSETEVQFVTPPGSPGVVDVTLLSATGQAVLRNGFLFTVKRPEIYAVRPNYGSRAGNTQVEVLGAGFSPTSALYFGVATAREIQVVSYSRMVARTPVADVGTVAVQVGTPSGMATLDNSFTYFDPLGVNGGVWGAEIDGSVNVTVLNGMTWEGLEGANVVLGHDVATSRKGETDARGQVTLSALQLKGPVDVHVYKPGWDASSVVQTNGENVTVYLIPNNPPDPGNVEPPPELLPGSVQGFVGGLSKYVLLPPGNCADVEDAPEGLCAPCGPQRSCDEGLECLELERGRFHCSRSCQAGMPPCPEGFTCAPVGAMGSVCAPEQGKREARCQITSPYMYKSLYGDDYKVADPNGNFLFESRLGEVAVVCLGGYVAARTGEFFPLAMGIRRHINVAPGAVLKDQNVDLNIPLNRSLRLRLDSPPAFENYSGEYRVEGYLELGSDGYFALPDSFAGLVPSDLVLKHMPESLTGDLYDARYIFIGGAYTVIGEQSPYSVVYAVDVTDLDSAGAAVLTEGVFEERSDSPAWEINAVAAQGSQAMLAGVRGRVIRYEEGEFRAEPSVTVDDWQAIEALSDGSWIAVGNRGSVGQKVGSNWESAGSVVEVDLFDVAGVDASHWVAVGPHRLVVSEGGNVRVLSVTADLRAVTLLPDGRYVVAGPGGALLVFDGSLQRMSAPVDADWWDVAGFADGGLVLSGTAGVFRMASQGIWEELDAPVGVEIRRLRGHSSVDFWAAGMPGAVYHYSQASGWEAFEVPRGLRSMDIVHMEDSDSLVVGTPAMLLTPFMPFPIFRSPLDGGGMKKLLLDWIYEGEVPYIGVYSLAISEKYGQSMWRIVAKGTQTHIRLPDFAAWLGQGPIRGGEKRLRFYSGYAPSFDISNFDLTNMSTFDWGSFVYDLIAFE